jgi:uncharacterized protein (TIGR03546 family)
MLRWLIRPARALVEALTDAGTPQQLALGFTLGMLVGLVPKDNLTAWILATLLLATRSNLAMAGLGAFAFSWMGMLLDPLSHRIGLMLLEAGALRPIWTWLFQLPLMPWTALNNSVVLGSLVLGIMLLYPVYRVARPLFAWLLPRLTDRAARWHIGKVLYGADVIANGGSQ